MKLIEDVLFRLKFFTVTKRKISNFKYIVGYSSNRNFGSFRRI